MSPRSRLPRITVVSRDPGLARLVAERLSAAGDLEVDLAEAAPAAGRMASDVTVTVDATDGTAGAPLTPREIEVLELLADGLANKQIAGRLGISDHTVKFHVESIMRRLGTANRAEAVREGIRRGILGL